MTSAKPPPLSRRAFLRAAVAAPTHISSVIVRVKPARAAAVAAAAAKLPGGEVAWQSPDGAKLVLLLEADSDAALLRQINALSAISGVMTVDLTYAYQEGDVGHG